MPLNNNPALRPTTSRGTIGKFYNPNDQNPAFVTNAQITMPDGSLWDDKLWDATSESSANITLTANTKFESPQNMQAGILYVLSILQDSTGGRKTAWGAAFDWDINGEPTLAQTPGARTVILFYCTGEHMLGSVFYKTPENDNPSTI